MLDIFNSKKEKIKTLVNEVKELRTHQGEFKPNGFTDRVYLYQLTAGSVMLTKKKTLIK